MFLIIAQLFVLSNQFDFNYTDNYDKNLIFIQSESVGITIFKGHSSFQIYAMQNKSYVVYNSSLESQFHLTYDDTFKINNKSPMAIESRGNIVIPSFLKMFLANQEPCSSFVEPIEICFEFTEERLVLKAATSILGFMLILTNLKDIQKAYMSIKQQRLEESTLSDNNISWRRLFSSPETTV